MLEFYVKSGYVAGIEKARTAELAAVEFARRNPPKQDGKVEVWELGPVETFHIKSTLSIIKK